jgi:hypothetical protein
MDEAKDIRRRLMGREGDHRRFEKTRKVREEQTRSAESDNKGWGAA